MLLNLPRTEGYQPGKTIKNGPAFAGHGAEAVPAPVARLPVMEVLLGTHILANLTLGLGEVIHDYLA
jgi:acetoacetate decarboxylase